MKPKDHCQECGKFMCSKKLKKSPIDGRLLCGACFIRIVGIKVGKNAIMPVLSNSMENKKKVSGRARIGKNNSYMIRGEEEIIKQKYGRAYCGQFTKLKKALGETRMKMVMDNSESIDRQKREIDLNKRFNEGLK